MNAEHEVLEFETDDRSNVNIVRILDEFDYSPLHFCRHAQNMEALNCDLSNFIRCRTINSARNDANNIFAAAGVIDHIALSLRSLGLSLTDHYWYRPSGSEIKWKDVGCFDREYDTSFGEAILRRDYEALAKADPYTPDCTLGGISRKAWIRIDGSPLLLKSEAGTSKFIEQSELLSARLTERLLEKSDYVAYARCEYAGESYIACRGMVGSGEEFIPASDILTLMGNRHGESFKYISKDKDLLDRFTAALKEAGIENISAYYAKLAAVFNLSLAGDCHLNNFGFIRDLTTMKLKAAPLFDRGRSFGSFGEPIENGRYSCAEYAIESTATVFIMMLFHSTLIHNDWDFSWYDPKKLDGFEDDIDNMLSVCEDIPKQYIEMLKAAFQYQLDYLNKAAGYV